MDKIPSILVVDDDLVAAEMLTEVLTREGYSVSIATGGHEAVSIGQDEPFDVVITDLRMPGMTGLEVMAAFKKFSPRTATVVITAFGSFETAIEAIQNGAYDYITKPFKIEDIKTKVRRCLEQKALLRSQPPAPVQADPAFKTIIGTSPKMFEIYKTVARVAPSDVPVLIQGESGTGKELIARAIHDNSSRASRPYIVVNCAAFPETLLESELFGYVKGAFTNALTDKKGLIEEARGGTCFLDEIGDMPLNLQVKLLRVLQKNEIRRLGGSQSISVDVRFIAASNRDIAELIREKQFREDLYYRLHVVTINLPPLRDHLEDIPLLCEHFFRKSVLKARKDIKGISKEAMETLASYHWPGNIRQLENVIERAVTLTSNQVLMLSDIPSEIHRKDPSAAWTGRHDPSRMPTLEEVKMDYIEKVLRHTQGNQNMAADILGIDRKTLYRILRKSKPQDEQGGPAEKKRRV